MKFVSDSDERHLLLVPRPVGVMAALDADLHRLSPKRAGRAWLRAGRPRWGSGKALNVVHSCRRERRIPLGAPCSMQQIVQPAPSPRVFRLFLIAHCWCRSEPGSYTCRRKGASKLLPPKRRCAPASRQLRRRLQQRGQPHQRWQERSRPHANVETCSSQCWAHCCGTCPGRQHACAPTVAAPPCSCSTTGAEAATEREQLYYQQYAPALHALKLGRVGHAGPSGEVLQVLFRGAGSTVAQSASEQRERIASS